MVMDWMRKTISFFFGMRLTARCLVMYWRTQWQAQRLHQDYHRLFPGLKAVLQVKVTSILDGMLSAGHRV